MKKKRIENIKKEVEKEFPGDFALQQIHIARKLLSQEAKDKKISFWKYIKMQVKKAEEVTHGV